MRQALENFRLCGRKCFLERFRSQFPTTAYILEYKKKLSYRPRDLVRAPCSANGKAHPNQTTMFALSSRRLQSACFQGTTSIPAFL